MLKNILLMNESLTEIKFLSMAKEPDYYTVMERSIRYYSQKYDPDNLLSPKSIQTENDLPPAETERKQTGPKNLIATLFFF